MTCNPIIGIDGVSIAGKRYYHNRNNRADVDKPPPLNKNWQSSLKKNLAEFKLCMLKNRNEKLEKFLIFYNNFAYGYYAFVN